MTKAAIGNAATPVAARPSGPDRTRFARIVSLARGTVLAQLVFVLATPILTRIYTAEEMGIFGVLVALVMIFNPFVGLRYELAIPLPRRDDVALHLVWLSSSLALLLSLVVYMLYLTAVHGFGLFAGAHTLQAYVPLVLAGLVLFVVNESLAFWFIRTKAFGVVANARVVNAVSLAMVQLSGFFVPAKLAVLLGAYPLALLASTLYLASRLQRSASLFHRRGVRLLATLARRYREFPLYSTWTSSVFELSQALPLFVLGAFYGNTQVGYFFLARRIGLIPTSVVGRAISQVNHSEMLEHRRSGALAEVLLKQIHGLQWLAILPAAALAWFAPTICERLLGEQWRVSGEYLQLMTPYVVVRFFFAPLHAINLVAEWQRQGFWVELASTAMSTAALFWYASHGSAYASVAGYFAVLGISILVYQTYLMRRLGVHPLRVLWPALLQLVGLVCMASLMSLR